MKVLMVGNCLFNRPAEILNARGFETHMTYMANPVTLLYTDRIPEGLAGRLAQYGITDRLERRTLAFQYEGIAAEMNADVVFVNYYQELRPLLRHKRERFFLHLNFQMIKAFEPPEVWDWITQNFDIVDTEPEKYIQRFTGLLVKIRENFPKASIIVANKFHPVRALGPVAEWICTEGRPFDAPYLDKMEHWISLLMDKDPDLYLYHTENIILDFLKTDDFNFQFLYPEICTPASGCTMDNYIRDLEHPSELYYSKFSEAAEEMIRCHANGDKAGLRRICGISDMDAWRRFAGQDFSMKPMTLPDLQDLVQDNRLTSQMVAMENTLQFEPRDLIEVDRTFARNLRASEHFIELKNNFRTVFRIQPRVSLLPVLELFLDYYRELNRSKRGKNYYLLNVQDFEEMADACQGILPAQF